jgi:hypothetical protein
MRFRKTLDDALKQQRFILLHFLCLYNKNIKHEKSDWEVIERKSGGTKLRKTPKGKKEEHGKEKLDGTKKNGIKRNRGS